MSRTRKLMLLTAVVLAPIAISTIARTAQASGYMVASGIDGQIICTDGGNDDCPAGGIIS